MNEITRHTPAGTSVLVVHHYGIDRGATGHLVRAYPAPCGTAADVLVNGVTITINAHSDFLRVITPRVAPAYAASAAAAALAAKIGA